MKDRTYSTVFGDVLDCEDNPDDNIKLDFHSSALRNELKVLKGKKILGFYGMEYKLVIYLEDNIILELVGGAIGGDPALDVSAELVEESDYPPLSELKTDEIQNS